jgi:hypothetical protein
MAQLSGLRGLRGPAVHTVHVVHQSALFTRSIRRRLICVVDHEDIAPLASRCYTCGLHFSYISQPERGFCSRSLYMFRRLATHAQRDTARAGRPTVRSCREPPLPGKRRGVHDADKLRHLLAAREIESASSSCWSSKRSRNFRKLHKSGELSSARGRKVLEFQHPRTSLCCCRSTQSLSSPVMFESASARL